MRDLFKDNIYFYSIDPLFVALFQFLIFSIRSQFVAVPVVVTSSSPPYPPYTDNDNSNLFEI